MKVGDLVRFRFCAQQGKVGIISLVPKQSYLAQSNSKLAIYWVVFDKGYQCFTGSQLEIVNDII